MHRKSINLRVFSSSTRLISGLLVLLMCICNHRALGDRMLAEKEALQQQTSAAEQKQSQLGKKLKQQESKVEREKYETCESICQEAFEFWGVYTISDESVRRCLRSYKWWRRIC